MSRSAASPSTTSSTSSSASATLTRIAEIRTAVSSTPALIADGHHRYAVSRQYRDERRAEGGDPGAELTLAFVGELVADQLSVEAIHRLYSGITADDLATQLGTASTSSRPTATSLPEVLGRMPEDGRLVLVRPDRWDWLVPNPAPSTTCAPSTGCGSSTRSTGSGAEVTYQHGLDETVAAVRGGDATAAVLIRPVSVEEIRRTAEERLLMPPKSTYFTPKLRTGLVIRDLAPLGQPSRSRPATPWRGEPTPATARRPGSPRAARRPTSGAARTPEPAPTGDPRSAAS